MKDYTISLLRDLAKIIESSDNPKSELWRIYEKGCKTREFSKALDEAADAKIIDRQALAKAMLTNIHMSSDLGDLASTLIAICDRRRLF